MTKSNPTTIRTGSRRWIYTQQHSALEAEIVVYGQHYGALPIAGEGFINLEINSPKHITRQSFSIHEARQLIDMLVAAVADVEGSK